MDTHVSAYHHICNMEIRMEKGTCCHSCSSADFRLLRSVFQYHQGCNRTTETMQRSVHDREWPSYFRKRWQIRILFSSCRQCFRASDQYLHRSANRQQNQIQRLWCMDVHMGCFGRNQQDICREALSRRCLGGYAGWNCSRNGFQSDSPMDNQKIIQINFAILRNYYHLCIRKRDGGIAQLARAPALQAGGRRFDSDYLHNSKAFPDIWKGFFHFNTCNSAHTPNDLSVPPLS